MCIDLRGSYITSMKEVDYLLEYGNELTLEDIERIAFDKEAYEEAYKYAVQNEELTLIL